MAETKLHTLALQENDPNVISFIAGDFMDGNLEMDLDLLPDELAILPLRNTVVFPGSSLPISVGRKKTINLVKSLGKKIKYIGMVCQKDTNNEDPQPEDLYKTGVIAEVLRVIELSENNFSIIVQAKKRFTWSEMTQTDPFFKASYEIKESIAPEKNDKEFDAVLGSIRESMLNMLSMLGEPPKELINTINSESFSNMLVSYSATNLPIDSKEKQKLLEIDEEKQRAMKLLTIMNRETQVLELKMNIQMKTREDLNQQQKEYYLQQQIRTIQEELGGGNTQQIEIDEFKEKAKEKKWSKEVAKVFEK